MIGTLGLSYIECCCACGCWLVLVCHGMAFVCIDKAWGLAVLEDLSPGSALASLPLALELTMDPPDPLSLERIIVLDLSEWGGV